MSWIVKVSFQILALLRWLTGYSTTAVSSPNNAYLNGSTEFFEANLIDDNKLSDIWVTNIAIFLLGSFRNSESLLQTSRSGETDFFSRIEAAKVTWAKNVKHLYYVTGSGEFEDKVLSNSNLCLNISAQAIPVIHRNSRQEMYHCAGIHILHFKHCDNKSWGHSGPCCRCSNAMRFFLAMTKFRSHNKDFPEWFIFSDDDYYMRVHMLDAILKNPMTPPTEPYSVSWANIPHDPPRPHFGLQIFNENCSVPCVHRFPWMGWGGFSVAALTQIEESILNEDLVSVCSMWQTTHDTGLGIFNWIHGFTAIVVKAQDIIQQPDSVLWHNPIRFDPTAKYDVILRTLWNRAYDEYAAAHPEGDSTVSRDKFDLEVYVAYERAAAALHMQHIPLRNISGFHNSLVYQRAIKKQHDNQRDLMQQQQQQQQQRWQRRSMNDTAATLQSLSTSRIGHAASRQLQRRRLTAAAAAGEKAPREAGLSMLAYRSENCAEDKALFNSWAPGAGWGVVIGDETTMCDQYSEFIRGHVRLH